MNVKLCGFRTLKERNVAIVRYMLTTDATCKQAAEEFGVCKTTIENACHYVIALGYKDRRYARMKSDIQKLFDCHIERAKFPKFFWKWFESPLKKHFNGRFGKRRLK